MIARTIDRLTAEHPGFAAYCKERINHLFDTPDSANIAIFYAAAISAGVLAGMTNDVIRWGAVILAAGVCATVSLAAGFLRQWFFIFFTALYFMLPYVFVIVPDDPAETDSIRLMISDLMCAVPLRPMRLIAGDGDPQIVSIVLLAVSTAVFLVGAKLRSTAKRSDFYCRTRLDQLE
ncbi:MAG: hypothetical protein IK093_20340 [Ruminiclostridium sp.]|nr:hypothetical protein [Ruminiclostridium sp.]